MVQKLGEHVENCVYHPTPSKASVASLILPRSCDHSPRSLNLDEVPTDALEPEEAEGLEEEEAEADVSGEDDDSDDGDTDSFSETNQDKEEGGPTNIRKEIRSKRNFI